MAGDGPCSSVLAVTAQLSKEPVLQPRADLFASSQRQTHPVEQVAAQMHPEGP